MADDIETRLRDESSTAFALASIDPRVLEEAADTIASLRADLAETIGLLRIAQGFVMAAPIKHPQQTQLKHDLVKRIASILASHKENADG